MPAFAIFDLTGAEPSSLYQNTSGSAPATTFVGRARDLSGNNRDAVAIDAARLPTFDGSKTNFDEGNDYPLQFDASGLEADAYLAIRSAGSTGSSFTYGLVSESSPVQWIIATGSSQQYVLEPGNSTGAGGGVDTSVEVWSGDPAQWARDFAEPDDVAQGTAWTPAADKMAIGGYTDDVASQRAWNGDIYRVVVWQGPPSAQERLQIQIWLEGGDNLDTLLGLEPLTPEELFKASFEDASGRDPLPTALQTREDARKLAGHNVLVYQYPPYVTDVTVPIATLDDYKKLTMGSDHWFKIPGEPLLKMGRWAKIQGRALRENALEVDLVLFTTDNPLCFVEPT